MLYEVDRILQNSSSWHRLLDLCNCDPHGVCLFKDKDEKGKFINERNGFSCELFEINPYYWGDCTCGVTDLYSEIREHSGDCPFVHHNFIYHPTGFYIDWYKYSFRSSDMNQDLTIREIEDIFDICSEYLENIGFDTNKNSIEYAIEHDPEIMNLAQKQFECKLNINTILGNSLNVKSSEKPDEQHIIHLLNERRKIEKELDTCIKQLKKQRGCE